MSTYQLSFFFSISHSLDNRKEHAHQHTIELSTFLHTTGQFESFQSMEDIVQKTLQNYQNQYLNELSQFQSDASIERLGEVLYQELLKKLENYHMYLYRLEIGETPLRVYAIGNEELVEGEER